MGSGYLLPRLADLEPPPKTRPAYVVSDTGKAGK